MSYAIFQLVWIKPNVTTITWFVSGQTLLDAELKSCHSTLPTYLVYYLFSHLGFLLKWTDSLFDKWTLCQVLMREREISSFQSLALIGVLFRSLEPHLCAAPEPVALGSWAACLFLEPLWQAANWNHRTAVWWSSETRHELCPQPEGMKVFQSQLKVFSFLFSLLLFIFITPPYICTSRSCGYWWHCLFLWHCFFLCLSLALSTLAVAQTFLFNFQIYFFISIWNKRWLYEIKMCFIICCSHADLDMVLSVAWEFDHFSSHTNHLSC